MSHSKLKISSANSGSAVGGKSTRVIVSGGFFIALGVILPWLFHQFKLGSIFLPMHIPVLLAGFFTGPFCGLAVGFLAPLINFSLTGMPPMMPPILPVMLIELPVYGLTAGIFYRVFKLKVFVSLILSMIAGRVALGLGVVVLAKIFAFYSNPLFYIKAALLAGLPGMILQLVIIPVILKIGERFEVA